MLSFTVLVYALATTSLTLSAPLSPETPGRLSFPVHRRQTSPPTFPISGGTPAYPLDGSNDWVATVSFGGQEFNVLLDTGSSLLWTLSDLMSPDQIASFPGHNFYNASASPTWQVIPDLSLQAFYGDGSYGATGVVGTETVTVGPIQITMPIGAANQTIGEGLITENDGLMGLAFVQPDANGLVRQPTFMMAVQDHLEQPIFTTEFHSNTPGNINFGYVDTSKFDGSLFEVPVDNQTASSWLVDSVSFGANGAALTSKAYPLLFDTGGLGTTLPEVAAADNYWSQVQGATQNPDGSWIFPCDNPTPDLTISFPGMDATISGSVLNNASSVVAGNEGMCNAGLKGVDGDTGNAGDAFFLSFFTVWNQAEPSLSFAPYVSS